jgi:hypothetical protein
MSFEEKQAWVSGLVTLLVTGWYLRVVTVRLGGGPVEEVAYQGPLLAAVGAMIVLNVVGAIVMAIATAVGAEVTGSGSAHDVDRTDERDALIEARGDRAAYYVAASLMIGVLALAMLERPHFWIATGVFAALVVAGTTSIAVKLVAYRRGF